MKIKRGDNILVTAGKDKGKTGTVIKIYRKRDQIVVEKVNMRTKHIKKRVSEAGQRIQFEAPINVSNVSIICPHCKKAVRIGYNIPEAGKKQRVCKKCKQSLDKKPEVKSKK